MPNPGLPDDEQQRRFDAIHAALEAGYPPPERSSRADTSAIIEAAKALSINAETFRTWVGKYRSKIDWARYQPDKPVIVEVPERRTQVRIRVRAATHDRPDGPTYRVLAIGDAHDSPHIDDKKRFEWFGRYAAEHRIPYIRQIGDWGTFDSCSQYEDYATLTGRFKPSFEDDIQSLEASLGAFVSQFPDDYRPDARVTLGNHENRVNQWENDHPEVEGMMVLRMEQAFDRAGFAPIPYGEWDFLGGVGFIHTPMNIMGRPYGGKQPENSIVNDAIFSIVFGHTHKRNMIARPKIGPQRRITILNLGCALPYNHVETYAVRSTTGWSYGVYDITIQAGDIISERYVSMLELEEMYG